MGRLYGRSGVIPSSRSNFAIAGVLYPASATRCLNANVFYLIIQGFKCPAVMLIAGIYTITQNPSVFVTGCLHGIRKNIFMLTLSEPSAFRIRCTFLDRFFFFSIRAATTGGGSLGSSFFSFRGFFPCASRSSLISFFNCSSKNSASSSAIRFRIFLLFARAFTWVASTKTRKDRSVCIYSIPAGYGKRSVQKDQYP